MAAPSRRKVRKRGGILNSILYILLLPVYLLGKIVPRDKKLLAFGSGHGDFFMDNPKYFFLYCSQNLEDARCIYFSRDPEVVSQLRHAGFNACYTYSLKGFVAALRARTCFISHSTHDVHALLIGGAEIIQLWHGTPLKKIAYDILSTGRGPKEKVKNFLKTMLFSIFPYLNTSLHYDKLTISAEFTRGNFKTAFRAQDSQIVITGQPRNDALAEGYEFHPDLFRELPYLKSLRSSYDHVITWMPTHRLYSGRGTLGLLDQFGFSLTRLTELLERYNAVLLTKVHFLDRSALSERLKESSRIEIYPYPDPYPLLRFSDVLITDYSSVIFDFLLLNRPVIFTPFDLQQYIQSDASFYYRYAEVTPGRRCANWQDVLEALEYHLNCRREDQIDTHQEQRLKVCRLFNDFKEGFSERVANTVLHPHEKQH